MNYEVYEITLWKSQLLRNLSDMVKYCFQEENKYGIIFGSGMKRAFKINANSNTEFE